MSEGAIYPRSTIDRLVEGLVWKGPSERKGDWYEVDGAWAEIRSSIERTGDIESSGWLEVMDLENAIASLRGEHPDAAAVVWLRMGGFDREEIRRILRANVEVLEEKAKNYLSAYLSGDDPARAYRRRVRPRAS